MSARKASRLGCAGLVAVLLTGHLLYPATEPSRNYPGSMTINKYGIVATSQTLASQAGATVLARGGSAVDAAIAANAALGVIEPMMNGIGGDLFAIVYDARAKKLYGINASGWVPQGMSVAALKTKGVTGEIPTKGIYSVTVPGAVAGWDALHKRFGRLSLAQDLHPAIDLATEGFPVTEVDAFNWKEFGPQFASEPMFRQVYLPGDKAPEVGQLFRNPDLAASLRLIGEKGREGFYRGPIAEAILKLSQQHNGFMTENDLAMFEPEWIDPISTTYHGWTIYEMPPNGQGVAALSMLNIMERFPLRQWGHDSVDTLHTEIEAKKLAYADLQQYVGDPRSGAVPTAELISKALAERRAQLIENRAQCNVLPATLQTQMSRLGSDTTYLAVVDRDGNEVSLIQSNNSAFGSGLVPAGTGFVLHNRAAGFTMQPGHPNSIAPHKRPLHTIIPALMQKDETTIAFGIMGGFNQAQAHAQFVSNVVDFDMNIQAAMDAARFSKRDFGGCGVPIESGFSKEVLHGLEARGHELTITDRYTQLMGRGNVVLHDGRRGVNFGASDPRADGQAIPEEPPSR